MRILLSLALIGALTGLNCKKDESGPADAFVGSFKGTYATTNGGASLSFNDVVTEVTKRSKNSVKIDASPALGIEVELNADVLSETQLVIPPQQVLSQQVEGEGDLLDNRKRLKLTFTASDGSTTTFDGERQ
jgi:hypothetical protein